MKRPIMRIGLGSGSLAWLSVDLDSIRFILKPENGAGSVETLTLAELHERFGDFPVVAGLAAGVLAQAVKTNAGRNGEPSGWQSQRLS